MSKLVQSGNNPKYPKTVTDYWHYSDSEAPPTWITDLAKIREVTTWAVLDSVTTDSGGIIIESAAGGPLVSLECQDSWICRRPDGQLFSITDRQKYLLYDEEK